MTAVEKSLENETYKLDSSVESAPGNVNFCVPSVNVAE